MTKYGMTQLAKGIRYLSSGIGFDRPCYDILRESL